MHIRCHTMPANKTKVECVHTRKANMYTGTNSKLCKIN